MKDINGQLMQFLHEAAGEEDLNEIVYQIQAGAYRSLRLINLSRTRFIDSDFIFNNQQYKFVVTCKLPLFESTTFNDFEESEMDDEILLSGDEE